MDAAGSRPTATTVPVSGELVPSGVILALAPIFTAARSLSLTVVVTCMASGFSTTIVAVLDPALTDWPGAMLTAATRPLIGLISRAWSRLCWATRSTASAASTAAWSAAI